MIGISRLPDDDDQCGWWQLRAPEESHHPLSADINCDYAIVGAGWTGLAAAHRLSEHEPNARIVLLDAGRVGYGAAGRNSGFLFDLPFVFAEDAYRGREDDGRQEIGLYRAVIRHMRKFVQDHQVDCGWSEIGQYHVAADREGERELAVVEAGLRTLGETFSTPGEAELSAALGTDYYRAALHTPGTVQINPLALVRAYAAGLPANTAIYEGTPVTSIEPGYPTTLTTPSGTVSAGRVLLTTNAFLQGFTGITPNILPLMTFSSLTAPMEGIGNGPWGAVPTALFGTSMRRLADNRVLVRNTYAYAPGYRADERLRAQAKKRQLLSLQRRFPQIGSFDLQWSWGGVISFFRGANGFFGEVAPGVFAASTSGMPVCILYGQQLAEYALGGQSDDLDFVRRRSQPGALPPEPFAGPIVRSAAAIRQRRAWREL